jgi:H+-transporting ATPase
MTPLGWGWAGFVWGYALIWFLLNDRIKLLAYRLLHQDNGGVPADTSATQPGRPTSTTKA